MPAVLALSGSWAGAGETRFVDLYSAEVAVASRAADERREAAALALQTVYNRITGSANAVAEFPQLASGLARAELMVSGYQYQQHESPEPAPQLILQFSFEQSAVRSALARAGAPWWAANRPLAEVWLVVQRGSSRDFVTRNKHPQLYDALLGEASRAGVPLSLPIEQGDGRLSRARAWQQDDADILQALSRGSADVALVGRVAEDNGSWQGQWKIYSKGDLRVARIQAESAEAVAAAGLRPLAASLARRFAVRDSAASLAQRYQLSINGLRDQRDYLAMMGELEGIDGLSDLQLLEVDGQRCEFTFSFNGSADRARALLGLNSRLVHAGAGDELLFSWRP
ncbi:MAG: DUF2066 domain-containing protein [Pseudomonadales bacterium]